MGLAAALIHKAEVLILDEPTSGLDPNQIVEIREVIKQQGKNKTVLFSSHILQEVEAICNRVIIINKGEIVADDKLINLQKAGSNQQSVTVEFKEKVQADWLENLNGVVVPKNIQQSIFNIQCSNAETVKKQLLQLSIDKNLNIVSLQSETQGLEEIFRSLTVANTLSPDKCDSSFFRYFLIVIVEKLKYPYIYTNILIHPSVLSIPTLSVFYRIKNKIAPAVVNRKTF